MTDDTVPSVDISEDLDAFSAELFGKANNPAKEAKVEDTGDDAAATDEDTDAPAETGDEDEAPNEDAEDEGSDEEADDSEAEEDSDADDEDEEDKPEPKAKGKNRKSAQERINEITKRAREAERREAALLQRLEALEARDRNDSKSEPKQEKPPQGAPTPTDVDEDGERLYPLGEFDPAYVAAITRYSAEQAKKEIREELAREAEQAKIAAAQNELRASWETKLTKAEEDVPEIREHIVELVDTFQGLEPAYGEYLATTIMQCENGPMIMEYLSQNIGEAQKIVASGPMAATLAIGRLEAKLTKTPVSEEKRNTKKVSAAPPVPAQQTKGRKGNSAVRADTDDQDAFEEIFFLKKK